MKHKTVLFSLLVLAMVAAVPHLRGALGAITGPVLTVQAAFTDYKKEAPGVAREITVADLPQP